MAYGRSGLSLIEALVILAVLSVLVGLAIPRLDSAAFRADANVRLVRSTLSEAKRVASDGGHNVLVSFALDDGRIRVVQDSDNNGAASPGDKISWKGLTDGATFVSPTVGVSGEKGIPPIAGSTLTLIDSMPTVILLKDGSASSSMQLYLQVRGARSNAERSVSLIDTTGHTQWFRMTRSGWKRGG